jgi:hypothetical protein
MTFDPRCTMLRALTPVTKVVGKIHIPHVCAVTDTDYREINSLLLPGMVFLTRTNWNLTNLLIPSESGYKHGAIYVGNGIVVEATGKGVATAWLEEFLCSKDKVRVLFPLFADAEERKEAARFAMTLVGRPYDYEFKSGLEALYCFEVVYAAYREARLKRQEKAYVVPNLDWDLREFWGETTVVADDFVKAVDKWRTVGIWAGGRVPCGEGAL